MGSRKASLGEVGKDQEEYKNAPWLYDDGKIVPPWRKEAYEVHLEGVEELA